VLPWPAVWREDRRRLVLLALFPAAGFLGIVFIRLLLAPPRDWDLFASYLYFAIPILGMAWLARSRPPRLPRFSAFLVVLAFLHAFFWGTVDTVSDRGFRRAHRLYGEGSAYSPLARGRAAEELAIAERWRGNLSGAKEWYRLAAASTPGHWRYHQNYGAITRRLGEVDKAAEAFARAVALSPPTPDSYVNLGSIQLQRRRVGEALQTYESGLRHSGPEPRLYYGKGVALAMMGRNAEAAAALDSSLALAPREPGTLLYRGAVALRSGEAAPAVALIRRALILDPDVRDGWRFFTEAAEAAGDSISMAEARQRRLTPPRDADP
jgi:Flp pilus assembly protein TadD